MSLLDGNTDVLVAELEKALGDEAQIEAVRLQLLDSPELAEAMGVSMDILLDPVRWAEAAAESTDNLLTQMKGTTGLTGGAGSGGSSSTGRAMRTHQAAAMRELLKSFSQQQQQREREEEGEVFFSRRKNRFPGRAA